MRQKNSLICGILAFAMFVMNSMAAARDWAFVDLNSGARAALFEGEGLFVADENGVAAEFCEEGEFRCFETELFSFAVPQDAKDKASWSHNGRIYCVINRFGGDKPKKDNDFWLIFSRTGGNCMTKEGFDQSAVYSRHKGLRYMSSQTPSDGRREMWATDIKGFAAEWTE